MKIIFTQCLLIIGLICINGKLINAQQASGIPHSFTVSTVTPPALPAGGVNYVTTAAQQDEFDTLISPAAGWSFVFAGQTYTRFVVSTNGWLALIPSSVGTLPVVFSGNAFPNNQLNNNTTGYPVIAPLWDNLTSSLISYVVSPANVLWVRWTVKWQNANPAAASSLFWAKLDGTTNTTTFYYANNTTYVPFIPSASIGIAGTCSGDFYSVNCTASNAAYVDSVSENINIGQGGTQNFRPYNCSFTFTPYSPNDNCSGSYPALDLGTINNTCTYTTSSTFNAVTSGSGNCSTTEVNDVWFKFTKPAGISNVKITTAPATCQSVTGTSVSVYSSCGGVSLGCATTSLTNPGYGEVIVSRTCYTEVLWIRVTANGDVAGKFKICVRDAGPVGSSGTTCSSSTSICSIPFSATGLSTSGFINDYDSANSACHDPFMNGEDYVFSYTPTSNGCIKVSVNSTGANPGVFIFDACPNLLGPSTHCIASSTAATGNVIINSVSLVAGTTYYILIDNNPLGAPASNIPFDISITSIGTSQPYDACGAVSLGSVPNNQSCLFSSYTTECATPSSFTYPTPTCGNFTNNLTGDVWFSFTAAFSGSLLIKTQPGAINPAQDIAMSVYTGINCTASSGSLFACDDNSAGSGMPLLSIPVANGTTYYIRVWTVAPANSGSFDLCISSACSPPNDLPCTAILVNLGGVASGFNTCAGSGGEPANAAQCVAGGIINTVWYKAVVPASGSVKVRTHTRSLSDTQIQAYSFPTGCANAATSSISRGCNDDGPDCGSQGAQSYHDFSELTVSGLIAGDTLFVAVDGYNSQTGTFDITFVDGTAASFPPVAGADCDGAYDVCGPSPIIVNDPGILGYGNICDFSPSYDCWANGERNSAWYKVTVNPGVLQFDVQTFSDYDFIMWDITNIANPCSLIQTHAIPSIRCNWVTTISGHTGISIPDPNGDWEPAITVTGSPRTFLINLDNWNPPFQTTGFTLDWMSSPIAAVTPSVTWQGAVDTSFGSINNWGTAPCNALPSCSIDAVITSAGTGRQPTISANMSVRNITINSGGSLRLKSPFILDVCGNFINNGTFIAEPGSTVRLSGTANTNQTISGTLTGTNSFSNFVINKPASSGVVIFNSNVDVAGNFTTINGTSVLNINGKYLRVGGNFTNFNGSTTFTGIGGSTVEFYSNLNQVFTNTNSTLSLNSVRINKTGGKLYLNGNSFSSMNIDFILTLTSGQIVTRALSSLEVNVKNYLPASVIGHNATSYIDGTLRRKISNPVGPSSPPIPASYDFPVGDSLSPGGYELANITFTSSTLVFDLQAIFNPWPAGPPNPGPVASECLVATYANLPLFNNGYWTFKRSTTTFGGNYNVALFNTGFTNNTGLGWTVVKSDTLSNPSLSSSWRLQGACVISSTPGNTQRSSMNAPAKDSTSFNHFYTTAQTNIALPVELLYFNAEPKGESVYCTWETASETNNDYFEVERSYDGTEFITLGIVNGFGHGTSTSTRYYSFPDNDPCKTNRYYRLKQVDIDGRFSYSDIVAINCSDNKNLFTVYPNPGSDYISTSFYEKNAGIIFLQWVDVIGQIVKEESHQAVKGLNKITTDISEINSGIYYLRLKNGDKNSVDEYRQIKFLKN